MNVLITGASSGIGRELARCFAQDGRQGLGLVLVGRRAEALEQMAVELNAAYGTPCEVIPADLSNPAEVDVLLEILRDKGIEIDCLVNNAGLGWHGSFQQMPDEAMMAMLRVNIEALTRLTHALLPTMQRHGYGQVVNIASTAAFQPGPRMAVYFATKAYVLHFGEALYEELKGTGIAVTTICPGPVASGFQAISGMGRARLLHNWRQRIPKDYEFAPWAFRQIKKRKRLAVHGFSNTVGTLLPRLVPRRLTAWFAGQILADQR